MAKQNQNFTMYAGKTKRINITVKDKDGSLKNLDDATIAWVLQDQEGLFAQKVITKNDEDIVRLSEGVFRVTLWPNDTKGLDGTYYHEAVVVDALGDKATVTTGWITIKPSAFE